jgi:site-specific recombinase XerD
MNELSVEKLLELENNLINPQDAVIAHLYNEGVEVHEIVYLKDNSLDIKNNELTVSDHARKKRRQVVSQKCVNLYQKAVKQTQYILNHHTPFQTVHLKDNGYLIKMSVEEYHAHENKKNEMDSVIYRTIFNRLRNSELGRLIFK